MKLRAKRDTWKDTATETLYFIQYEWMAPFFQFDGDRWKKVFRPKIETEGPYADSSLERKVITALNRVDVTRDSVQVIEKRVDGARRRRSLEQRVTAA